MWQMCHDQLRMTQWDVSPAITSRWRLWITASIGLQQLTKNHIARALQRLHPCVYQRLYNLHDYLPLTRTKTGPLSWQQGGDGMQWVHGLTTSMPHSGHACHSPHI
jgi:hypothetical protein